MRDRTALKISHRMKFLNQVRDRGKSSTTVRSSEEFKIHWSKGGRNGTQTVSKKSQRTVRRPSYRGKERNFGKGNGALKGREAPDDVEKQRQALSGEDYINRRSALHSLQKERNLSKGVGRTATTAAGPTSWLKGN